MESAKACAQQRCNLTRMDIGTAKHYDGYAFTSLCQGGRLHIDDELFHGTSFTLAVPRHGDMRNHIDGGKVDMNHCQQGQQNQGKTQQLLQQMEPRCCKSLVSTKLATNRSCIRLMCSICMLIWHGHSAGGRD